MLFVYPEDGRGGVARALVTTVLRHTSQLGLPRDETHAGRAARPAFERLGFVVDAENSTNMVRGVHVPNLNMHIEL